MPPAPAPAMAKRPSRLQNVITASLLQNQGEAADIERDEEDNVYESACAAPASPNVSRKSSTASAAGSSSARSPILPPSSTQGVAVSTRVRQALGEAARLATDASRQYRAAFRAYSEAWNSPDTPAETQAQALWALVYTSLRLGYNTQAQTLLAHAHDLLHRLKETGHLDEHDAHQHFRLKLSVAAAQNDKHALGVAASELAHELRLGDLRQKLPDVDVVTWQSTLLAAEALRQASNADEADKLIATYTPSPLNKDLLPVDPLMYARFIALYSQAVIDHGDRVNYPRCKEKLEQAIQSLRKESGDMKEQQELDTALAPTEPTALPSSTRVSSFCGACAIQLGKPCALWDVEIADATCHCALVQHLVHATRLYSRILRLLGEHRRASALDTDVNTAEASASAGNGDGKAFAALVDPLSRNVGILSDSFHNISMQVGAPQSERSSPEAPPITPLQRKPVAAAFSAMTPTLSMLDHIVEKERRIKAAMRPRGATRKSNDTFSADPRGVCPGRGMPTTPLTAFVGNAQLAYNQRLHRPIAPPQQQQDHVTRRTPLGPIQEPASQTSKPGYTGKVTAHPSLGALPTLPLSIDASAIEPEDSRVDDGGAGDNQPRPCSLAVPKTPPTYQSLLHMRSSSSTGVVSANGDPTVYQHLANRQPEYASMANPISETPLHELTSASTTRPVRDDRTQPVFLGQVGKRKGTRSLLSVWSRALKPEKHVPIS